MNPLAQFGTSPLDMADNSTSFMHLGRIGTLEVYFHNLGRLLAGGGLSLNHAV